MICTGDRNPAPVMEEMEADAEQVEARKHTFVMSNVSYIFDGL